MARERDLSDTQERIKGSKDLRAYLTSRVGVGKGQALRIIKALAEYITINLADEWEISIPRIGTLKVEHRKQSSIVKYEPNAYLYAYLRESRKYAAHPWAKRHNLDIVPSAERYKSTEEYLAKRLHKVGKRLGVQISTTRNPDLLRLDFLKYLQQDLPYGKSWTHPTSRVVYTPELIIEKLKVYKQVAPEEFNTLWLVWSGHSRRLTSLEASSASHVRLKWERAVDSLLMQLVFTDLQPQLVQSLLHNYDTD